MRGNRETLNGLVGLIVDTGGRGERDRETLNGLVGLTV